MNVDTPTLTDTSADELCIPASLDLDELFNINTDPITITDSNSFFNGSNDAYDLHNRVQQQDYVIASILEELRQLKVIVCQHDETLKERQKNPPKRKRKRKAEDDEWESRKENFLQFLRSAKRLPDASNEWEVVHAQWFETAMRDKSEKKLTVEQSTCFTYLSGVIDGIKICSEAR